MTRASQRRDQARYDAWLEQMRQATVAGIVEHALETTPTTLDVIATALRWALTSQGYEQVTTEAQLAREEQMGATGMWWLRETAGAIELDDIAAAGRWIRENAGDGPALATTLLTRAVWENDQDTQIGVLTDAGEDRRRLLPLLAVTSLVATAGRSDPGWLYAATGHEPPPLKPPVSVPTIED